MGNSDAEDPDLVTALVAAFVSAGALRLKILRFRVSIFLLKVRLKLLQVYGQMRGWEDEP